MVGHEHVGVEGQPVALAIAFQAVEVGSVIRVVMEDGGTAIAARNHVIERTGYIEPGLASHARDGMRCRCNKSILMPDPNAVTSPIFLDFVPLPEVRLLLIRICSVPRTI